MKPKFKIEKIKKQESLFRNIRFPKELWEMINKEKGNVSFNKFVVEACKYALDNMEE